METRRLPGTLDSLQPIRDFVRDITARAGLEKHVAYKLITGVDEIATNIVTHGYDEAGLEGDVLVRAEATDSAVTIELLDRGVPFNPLDRPAPDSLNMPLDDRPIGGLGIYMAVQGVDVFEYEYAEGMNINRFIVHRQKQADGTGE